MINKMWIGRKYKCIYGLNCDDVIEVISEPYSIDRRGTKAVSVISEDNGEEQIENRRIGTFYLLAKNKK